MTPSLVCTEVCRGACCEAFRLRVKDVHLPDEDAERWLELHGTCDGEWYVFECQCSALLTTGRCGIYSTRPLTCMLFEPGGPSCVEIVQQRRSSDEAERILRLISASQPDTSEV